jgi:hypothetical protein
MTDDEIVELARALCPGHRGALWFARWTSNGRKDGDGRPALHPVQARPETVKSQAQGNGGSMERYKLKGQKGTVIGRGPGHRAEASVPGAVQGG